MGLQKIPIKKLESARQRRDTFKYKRSDGIKKKVKELSILSDAEVLLLMRDPKEQYHLCHGENSTFDGVVQKFLSESHNNRDDSRQHGMNFLKGSYIKDNHALNALSLLDHGNKKNGSQEDMDPEHIKQEISKLESQLEPLQNIEEIDVIERYDELTKMECSIIQLLSNTEQEMVHIVQKQKSRYPADHWDSMASTSTARVESTPTAMYNWVLRDSSFQLSESERKMLLEWHKSQG